MAVTFKIPEHVTERIEKAMAITGAASKTQYIIQHILRVSNDIIEKDELLSLTEDDAKNIMKRINEPGKPTKAFEQSASKYNEMFPTKESRGL